MSLADAPAWLLERIAATRTADKARKAAQWRTLARDGGDRRQHPGASSPAGLCGARETGMGDVHDLLDEMMKRGRATTPASPRWRPSAASKTERHPTDLAMLRGARAVMAQETEDGQRWAESRIKALTGGDAISARFMRQEFFTFEPAFKLMIAGNHKPSLRNVDEAVRWRFNLVPFTVTIPKAERDPNLPQKLEAEWPGILAWAIEGCLEWQRIGLAPPPAVLNATEGYLADEDAIGRFLDERCETGDMLTMEEVKERRRNSFKGLWRRERDWGPTFSGLRPRLAPRCSSCPLPELAARRIYAMRS